MEPELAVLPTRAWNLPVLDRTLTAAFFLFCAAPLFVFLGGWDKKTLNENRYLAPAPSWEYDSMETMPNKVDDYYRDRFGFRATLITWNSIVRYVWLGGSNAEAVVGKQGWVFWAGEHSIENFIGLKPLTQEELRAWKTYLERRHNVLQAAGVKYLFVIAPDKQSIYPEMLPDYISRSRAPSHVDQLIEYLRASRSPVEVLDLRPALREAKSKGLVYFPQDTHWNGRGALVGHIEMLKRLQPWFPYLTPAAVASRYEVRRQACGFGDWNLLGLPEKNFEAPCDLTHLLSPPRARLTEATLPPEILPTPQPPIRTVQSQAQGGLLVLHDSFMHVAFDSPESTPLSDQFGHVYYYKLRLTMDKLMALIRWEHPDAVIEEHVERMIVDKPSADE